MSSILPAGLRRASAGGQELVVMVLALVIFSVFAIVIPGFLSPSNIASLVQNVSVLGIFAAGMTITIIGRGIDLSMVATGAISVGWFIVLLNSDVSALQAFGAAILLCLAIGISNGVIIAYLDVPPIFTTLAMGTIVYGFGKYFLIPADVNYITGDWRWLSDLAVARPLGIPVSVLCLVAVAAVVFVFLRFLSAGRFIYALGDNPATAWTTGIATRRLIVLSYVLSALLAFVGSALMALIVSGMNTRVASSSMVYDVILIAVLGGVALSGGRGGVLSVIAGTVLIGTLLNGMTMLNLDLTMQNIIKALTLLVALVVDSLLNPKDEQTTRQGDI